MDYYTQKADETGSEAQNILFLPPEHHSSDNLHTGLLSNEGFKPSIAQDRQGFVCVVEK